MRIFVVIALFAACAVNTVAQQQQAPSLTRAQEIAAAFNKQKHVVKEKRGVRVEKYKDVRSKPVIMPHATGYAGTYEIADLGFVINLQVEVDGRVHATGYEQGQQPRTFKLENAKIDGALLTASKVFQDGTSEPFEGVFLVRTVRDSPTDPGVTTYGLGVMLSTPVELNGNTFDRLFYQRKQ